MHVKFMYYNFVILKHPGNEQLFKLSHSASYNSSPRPGNTWACSLWCTS